MNSWHVETAGSGWHALERVQSGAAPDLLCSTCRAGTMTVTHPTVAAEGPGSEFLLTMDRPINSRSLRPNAGAARRILRSTSPQCEGRSYRHRKTRSLRAFSSE
jgi:hypothetical protein